mmetsp:Transcript_12239/g.14491  ORF Transcript_12239/g.14491 Transcript_12239/m.14491 type:complete len:82 (-) Transcript_12239:167-412(-)
MMSVSDTDPDSPSSKSSKAGVRNMPMKFDTVALNTAAPSFPSAVFVRMTHIEIVVGRQLITTMPSMMSLLYAVSRSKSVKI